MDFNGSVPISTPHPLIVQGIDRRNVWRIGVASDVKHTIEEPIDQAESRIDALRKAHDRLETGHYPYILVVVDGAPKNVFWKDEFETLEIRYDILADSWVVTPACGYFAFDYLPGPQAVWKRAKSIQQTYYFRELVFYDTDQTVLRRSNHPIVDRLSS